MFAEFRQVKGGREKFPERKNNRARLGGEIAVLSSDLGSRSSHASHSGSLLAGLSLNRRSSAAAGGVLNEAWTIQDGGDSCPCLVSVTIS